ncbi:MAG: mechanosensitive ion channel domain-containing protein [Candidatus Altiarchaeota archaeon]
MEFMTDALLEVGKAGLLIASEVVIIIVVAHVLIKTVDKLLGKILKFTNFDRTLEKFFHKSVIMLLWILTAGVILLVLGVDLNTLLASFGVMSFIVGFALKDTLSNFASGIMILVNKPFVVGDDIEIKEAKGTVKTVSMTYTKIVTKDGAKITIPNNVVWSNPIINHTAYRAKDRVRREGEAQ